MNVLLCPLSSPGYLYPAIAVGLRLRASGHRVFVLGEAQAARAAEAAGLPAILAEECGERDAFQIERWFVRVDAQRRAVERAARIVDADALLTSVLCLGALLGAELVDVPVVVLGLAAHLWPYAHGGEDEPRQYAHRWWRKYRHVETYLRGRDSAGLPVRPWHTGQRVLFGDGLLLRGAPILEFPGARLPDGVAHVGSCVWEPEPDPTRLADLWRQVEEVGKPLVYVHLGQPFGGRPLWPRLNAMFTDGPFQAVVELGRTTDLPDIRAGADIVAVREPWLGPLVDRSDLVMTNGTSAPVLAALRRAKPLVLAPNDSEQPLLSQACVRIGVGRYCPRRLPDVASVLTSTSTDMRLRARVDALAGQFADPTGADVAADVVQSVVRGAPVPYAPST